MQMKTQTTECQTSNPGGSKDLLTLTDNKILASAVISTSYSRKEVLISITQLDDPVALGGVEFGEADDLGPL